MCSCTVLCDLFYNYDTEAYVLYFDFFSNNIKVALTLDATIKITSLKKCTKNITRNCTRTQKLCAIFSEIAFAFGQM